MPDKVHVKVLILSIAAMSSIYLSISNLISIFFISQITPRINEKPFEILPSSTFLHLNQSIKRVAAIDRIFLINLPDRVDRRTTAIALFQKLHLDLHIFPAFHPHSPEVLSRRHHLSRHLTQLELACWASHVQLWTHITLTATNTHTWTLIFEDDVDIEMSIVDILESFPSIVWTQAEMIYLGYCGNPRGELLYTGRHPYQLHRARNPSCTHAYAIRSDSASKLIRLVSFPDDAIDDKIVRLNNEEKMIIYSIHPPIVIQRTNRRAHPLDVNPPSDGLMYWIKRKWNHFSGWMAGVEFIDKMRDSALAQADLLTANQWRIDHESNRWNISR